MFLHTLTFNRRESNTCLISSPYTPTSLPLRTRFLSELDFFKLNSSCTLPILILLAYAAVCGRNMQSYWLPCSLYVLVSLFSVSAVPSLSSLSIAWRDMPVRAAPVVTNFFGATTLRSDTSKSSNNVEGAGFIALGPITSAPYDGNFARSSLFLDGEALLVHTVTHGVCEAVRSSEPRLHNKTSSWTGNGDGGSKLGEPRLINRVRLPFEQHGLMQSWTIEPRLLPPSSRSAGETGGEEKVNVRLFFDGPYYRQCDFQSQQWNNGRTTSACGWGLSLPVDRNDFHLSVRPWTAPPSSSSSTSASSTSTSSLSIMVVTDSLSPTVTASLVFIASSSAAATGAQPQPLFIAVDSRRQGFTVIGNLTHPGSTRSSSFSSFSSSPSSSWSTSSSSTSSSVVVNQVTFVANTTDLAVAGVQRLYNSFAQTWEQACSKYELRWQSAFQPPAALLAMDKARKTEEKGKIVEKGKKGETEGEIEENIKSTPPPHFSGNLPSLSSNEPLLDQLYYWAALALVQLERTNLRSFPRSFVISEGASIATDGSQDMGGSGQFIWDLSFTSASLSLLEPQGTRHLIAYLIRYSNMTAQPILIPQAWDAFPAATPAGLGSYCFDYMVTFLFIQQYVAMSNDTAFLSLPLVNVLDGKTITPLQYLESLAWAWKQYPRARESYYLRNYGADKRSFLEVVPTYTSVVPALQFGNAGMLFALANLKEIVAGLSKKEEEEKGGEALTMELSWLRGNASAIMHAASEYQYVKGKGFWRCLYGTGEGEGGQDNTMSKDIGGEGKGKEENGGGVAKSAEVRAIADFVYLGIALGVMGGQSSSSWLPSSHNNNRTASQSGGGSGGETDEMTNFFLNELLADGWVRALSLSDPVMAGVYSLNSSVESKVAMRSDWTGTGAYGGLAGHAVEALAELEAVSERWKREKQTAEKRETPTTTKRRRRRNKERLRNQQSSRRAVASSLQEEENSEEARKTPSLHNTLQTLRNLSLISRSSMPAQGVAVMTPPYMRQWLSNNSGLPDPVGPFAPAFPEFFDESNFAPWWPNTSRSLQNAEAALVDAFIRTVFGWRPAWGSVLFRKEDGSSGYNVGGKKKGGTLEEEEEQEEEEEEDGNTRRQRIITAINGCLWEPLLSRGSFQGTLSNLPTPFGLLDLTAGSGGLTWSLQQKNGAALHGAPSK